MILCEQDYLSKFGSMRNYRKSKQCIVGVLVSCGMPEATALSLFKAGPKAIHLYFVNNPSACTSEWVLTMCKPKKTWYNKFGEFFALGTRCYCCLGYRLFLTVLAWPMFYLIGWYSK